MAPLAAPAWSKDHRLKGPRSLDLLLVQIKRETEPFPANATTAVSPAVLSVSCTTKESLLIVDDVKVDEEGEAHLAAVELNITVEVEVV